MNKKTLEALLGAIEKWEKIAEGKGIDEGTENCPLCKMFATGEMGCPGCPVSIRTGASGCNYTPYADWVIHHKTAHDKFNTPYAAECEDCKRLARKEVEFLRSLLPEGVKA